MPEVPRDTRRTCLAGMQRLIPQPTRGATLASTFALFEGVRRLHK